MEKKNRLKPDLDVLLNTFGLNRIMNVSEVELFSPSAWQPDGWEEALLQRKFPIFVQLADAWNEEELKMKLLAFLFEMADLDQPPFLTGFYERLLTAQTNEGSISVKVDFMLARTLGLSTPVHPYFFLQEFKKEKGDKQDPQGQMLLAMLAARELNDDGLPIFGGYVMGRYWYFSVLEKDTLSITRAFNAAVYPDLLQTVAILRRIKELVLARVPEKTAVS